MKYFINLLLHYKIIHKIHYLIFFYQINLKVLLYEIIFNLKIYHLLLLILNN